MIILILPGTLLGGIGGVMLWRRTLRLRAYLSGLEREEPHLQSRMNSIKSQIRELDKEIEELFCKTKQTKSGKII